MHKLVLATVVASITAFPALAANESTSSTPPNAAQIEQDLHQDLSKAGFTDIHIFPGSFMVHAKDSKGHPTEMMVSPNSVTEITAMGGPNSAGKTGSPGGNGTSGSQSTNK